MTEINFNNPFKFLDNWKKILVVSLSILIGFGGFIFKDSINHLIYPNNHLALIEQSAQLTDDDIMSTGYWKLNKETNNWECVFSYSIHSHNLCTLTGSFYNNAFVKQFQIKLEKDKTIIVTVNPENPRFDEYWRPIYKEIFGFDESKWGRSLYVIYFQIGDRDDLRRVIYTKDMNDANEGRLFTTEFKEIILDKLT